MAGCTDTYFSHDGDGRHHFGLGHPVLDQVVHVLVVQQTDEVKRAKAGRAAQSQVPNDHGTEETARHMSHFIEIQFSLPQSILVNWLLIHLPLRSPVEGPVEQKDLGGLWQGRRVVLVGL